MHLVYVYLYLWMPLSTATFAHTYAIFLTYANGG